MCPVFQTLTAVAVRPHIPRVCPVVSARGTDAMPDFPRGGTCGSSVTDHISKRRRVDGQLERHEAAKSEPAKCSEQSAEDSSRYAAEIAEIQAMQAQSSLHFTRLGHELQDERQRCELAEGQFRRKLDDLAQESVKCLTLNEEVTHVK